MKTVSDNFEEWILNNHFAYKRTLRKDKDGNYADSSTFFMSLAYMAGHIQASKDAIEVINESLHID